MAWIVMWVVAWAVGLSAQPAAKAPALRFHHLHYRTPDPLTAMRQLTGVAAAQPSILQGLGVGVRIGRDAARPEYVLFDRPAAQISNPQTSLGTALPGLVEWLTARGFAVDIDQPQIRAVADHLAADAFDHIAFAAADFPEALVRLQRAGVSLSKTTGEASMVETGALGIRLEIVRDPDQPDAFWCPMHPDVRSPAAGTCPICRMSLVPIPPPQVGEYRMDVDVLPSSAGSGGSGLRLSLESPSGTRPSLLTVHDKRLHLFVISEDLGYFRHVHPTERSDGRFEWIEAVPAGQYMVIADFMPAGGTSQMVQRAVMTRGYHWTPAATSAAAAIRPSSAALTGGIRATLAASSLTTGQAVTVKVSLADAVTGKPITDLEPYLSAPAHALMASADLTHVVHVHPQEQETFGPTLSFEVLPAVAGPYKLWVQVQRHGQVLTFPFVFAVGK